ncbi:uncharacterized protein LOC123875713 [Maniola jurtina]|uniref:uncharacterized protein LOC123875713 n=1 Tax=Maniola jurtina TaxID=191418 RepID=UPI001E68F062|nr:uncharacterized protein LOC123875713 [Maniola jurtina]
MTATMNHILPILYFLTLSAAISGKTIRNDVADDYPRYAYNQAIDSYSGDKAQFGYREDQLNGAYNPLQNDGNLRVVEYATDDFSSGFNAIVQKLAASLVQSSPLFGPLPLPLPPVNPLINPLHYGFGPTALPVGEVELPNVTVKGRSIPWDPKSRTFGGWKPLDGPVRKAPLATIVTRKYVNGQLYKVRTKPISLVGKTIIIKRRPDLD